MAGDITLPSWVNTPDHGNLVMDITQSTTNGVIKWDSFDVGGSATVNFKGPQVEGGYNTLNYVNAGGSMSQIYGTINANNNGNIFIVNPAGVQIGNSAQINVGSLYVSNKYLNENELGDFAGKITPDMINTGKDADAVLMSLGNINANKVTFEGDGRIVIDSERLKDVEGTEKLTADKIFVNTKDENNLVIGYDGYDENNGGSYNTASEDINIVTVNGNGFAQNKGYMWVEDVEQLQDINTNLGGNYALRNSIDGTQANDFTSIGNDTTAFTGKFDGIDYNIFNLDISGENNVGLFGKTDGATINNVTLVGGSITGTGSNVGAIVGNANNTTLTNVVNSAAVSGDSNVGGIVGIATDTTVEDAINTGAIEGIANTDNGGINVGGLIGSMNSSHLIGNSYNLGDVTSIGSNVGGLVGSASNSTIGNPSVVNDKPVENVETVYNRMDVTGAYNVGGIVGNMTASTVQNAENSGTVLASGHYGGEYTFHTDYTKDNYSAGGSKTVSVNVANVGGIAGTSSSSTITDVLNTGDVSSSKVKVQEQEQEYYAAGNVGGIVGSAVDTNITNATNRENEVRGAHNVGGVAGYFSGAGRITGGINDGGDIMATGARYTNNGATAVVTETIRKDYDGSNNDGKYVIGNIGGIVGYMEGDNVHIDASGNRGTVHTLDISDGNNISDASEAANVGGIVGKIDRSSKITDKNELGENYVNAAVSNSYNTGDVRGFTAIGGIAGMMYNGGIAGAYNLGEIRSTRVATGNETPLNMGGIVGDTTEVSNARAFIYDVYNKGKIGDEAFKYKGRHVGGIVGRLSGVVEKAYNTGAIYNGAAVTGGIAGYLSAGKIENVFNTGNITVENNDGEDLGTQLGGLVGAANIGRGNVNISNAYNLGVIRSFNGDKTQHNVGGIVGYLVNYTSGIQGENAGNLTIKNVYTTGDLYSEGGETTVGALYGGRRENVTNPIIQNAVYITPSNNAFTEVAYGNLQDATEVTGIYGSSEATTNVWNNFIQQSNVNNEGQTLDLWRVYDGTTPILNAFMPNSKDYFGDENKYSTGSNTGIDKIQYGTAYNPLLTIINANKDLVYDWEKLGINNDAGLAVYGYGVTLNNFRATGGTGYFGGTIYADGALNLNGNSDIGLGSASQIYGSDVTIGTNGKVTIYGDVTATGNEKDNNDTTGSISINAGEVDVYGALTSAKKDQQIQISGIAGSVNPGFNFENITDKTKPVTNVGDSFAHEVTASETGNITINAGQNGTGSGNVNLYYGNKQEGLITTGGDLTATGSGDVYVDSDLDIGGDLTLTGNGENSEVVLDLTNIGQVQAKNGTIVDAVTGLHNFMHHFSDTSGGGVQADNKTISLNSASGNSKITVDMWDYENDKFSLEKYDETTAVGHTFREELNNLNLKVDNTVVAEDKVKEHIYIWVSDGEQLQGINATANDGGLDFNYALKGDINASDVENYVAIGTNSANGFTGTFDGRGNRIIGLDTTKDANDGNTNFMVNAGIFSTIGEGGTVKNVNIYSGNFEGTNTAGAVAGMNSGRIENVTGFGNTVTVTGDVNNAGNAGGIVGVNNGKSDFETSDDGASTLTGNGIYDVQSIGSVIAGNTSVVAGGLVGTNEGALGNSYSDSAVTSTAGTSNGLGGVVGVNKENGDVRYVDSLGVTNGGDTGSSNIGGIIGINNGNMYSGYNESIVSGNDNVGGIIGTNSSEVENVVNATSVTGENKTAAQGDDGISEYVGGLVGSNSGSVTNGRNNGTITGTNYVGGLVGDNANEHSILTNLVNDSSAEILGVEYVGGIAGSNSGTITADEDNDNLVNRGSITGVQYVGGITGENKGTITNTNNDVELFVNRDKVTADKQAQYFGGVAGINQNGGTIKDATNTADVNADGANYVGGIAGKNEGTLTGFNGNYGNVTGASNVGGVIGENTTDIDNVDAVNDGTVIAMAGGAGGIFGVHTGDITNSKLVNNKDVIGAGDGGTGGIATTNSGKIINSILINEGNVSNATGDNVGGIFGIKDDSNGGTDTITGSTLKNNGQVTGKDNVGGIFGSATEKVVIKTTSMTNSVNATITGNSNVGGLIGSNAATITGGRNEKNSYYKYQIYNNGTITANSNGSNIGGLFGTNNGTVEAAYNTGVINADKSSNVGGIAGVNEKGGTLDQVFNTVMIETGSGAITGKDNVGGLVGTNSGTLSNAYNTTDVSGTTNVGNAVGRNEANATVNNVYDVNNTGNRLIAENNGNVTGSYSGNEADKKTTGITYVAEGDKLKEDSYKDSLNDADTWKFYDGNSNPLLKVFLTDVEIKVDVDEINEYINNVYNGNAQAITDEDIDKLIAAGAITAPDNFAAYNNAKELINSISHTNAGEYSDWLYSQQIASNGNGEIFNPNNLGYNIALTADIDTAKLTINLGEVTHIYGAPNTNGYNYTVEGWINPDDANDYTITIGTLGNGITDNALKDNNIHTNDVDEYTWSTTTASISANGSLNNYEIVTVKDGTSKVIPVTINVILNDVTHIYGDSFNSNDYTVGNVDWVNGDNYTTADVVLSNINDGAFTNGNGGKTNDVTADGYKWNATVNGNGANAESINKNYIFNVIDGDSKVTPKEVTIEDILASIEYGSKGDFTVENTGNINGTVYDDNLGISYTDTSVIAGSEYALNQNGRDTADVKVNNGVYTDSISINGIKLTGDKAGNYYISSDTAKGDIRVDKAQIHIGANNEAIHVGEKPDYIGTDINGALVNGDKLNGNYYYGVENSADEKVVGDHSIGVWIGNTFYDLSATVDWTKVDGFFANYNVTFVPGTLTVTEQVMPDLPDNWPNNRWDYLFGDNPFDRNENFRERKAEVNFVDGAMEI